MIAGDDGEQPQCRLDWQRMRASRRNNYLYLLELVQDLPGLEIVIQHCQITRLPFGLPVDLSHQRDRLLESLAERGIGLMTHWHEILSDPRLNQQPTAVDMAGRMITLVRDHRTAHKQLDYLAVTLRGAPCSTADSNQSQEIIEIDYFRDRIAGHSAGSYTRVS